MAQTDLVYKPKHAIRLVTATSLFDGHDAAINLMRRMMQASGAEVIHLGHNRSVAEIVDCAIQEDVQGIAITSYQGGHMEFFCYMYDLLKEKGAGHIRIVGGGGGTILPVEIETLHQYGIARLFSPDDGRRMGLQGMINEVLSICDFERKGTSSSKPEGFAHVARLITLAENHPKDFAGLRADLKKNVHTIPVLGITGTGGAGKSSLTDELIMRFTRYFPEKKLAILSVDPTRKRTGGALLGDRIRMNAVFQPQVYMRSMATRNSGASLSSSVSDALMILKASGFDLILLESSGIGQADTEITRYTDYSLYVMTAEYGAASQLEKIDMLDFADFIAINKFDKNGSADALRDVRKQWRRNHNDWLTEDENLPVFGTMASHFNDRGAENLFRSVCNKLPGFAHVLSGIIPLSGSATEIPIIFPHRVQYLAEIVTIHHEYKQYVREQSVMASKLYQLHGAMEQLQESGTEVPVSLQMARDRLEKKLDVETMRVIHNWKYLVAKYRSPKYRYQIRDKLIEKDLYTESLSHLKIPKISLPDFRDWGDIVRWRFEENVPGKFPYTAGVFPLKREGEDPARMFAGEGMAERTNRRFHYLSKGIPAKRLSTAFDSVTLYGEDPAYRPDIYGKVGNSGVSISTLDDAKRLYAGFNLCDPSTSVSMTINGPSPMLLAMFLNTAIDQQCEWYIRENGLEERVSDYKQKKFEEAGLPMPQYRLEMPEGSNGMGLLMLGITGDEVLEAPVYEKIKADTLKKVRGTVQADILKEDQAQNTCIFSTEFALRLMGDVQQYFINSQVHNFYSVSISGYHIAEAGANPITQLAFTLANGFTYVEYYLARGMHIDDFAPSFSFFFSNGLDPEYTVLGRVARRIWAKALRFKYKGSERSQKLKYHIQTSGRSLHAQEIDFNDIRTTLQALYALYDNCNSLHTNAYDEAITTPTEESVRRAMAIQLIINKELGLSRNENPLQGSFIVEELTELVEEAVMAEFGNISERGGVLGAMERMYQRSKIQDESMYYETLKHNGRLPVIGVNTFLNPQKPGMVVSTEVIRATREEKEDAITGLQHFCRLNAQESTAILANLAEAASTRKNVFEILLEAVKYCSLGQITHCLYEVGGSYRRNI